MSKHKWEFRFPASFSGKVSWVWKLDCNQFALSIDAAHATRLANVLHKLGLYE